MSTAVAGNGLVLLLLECSTKHYKPKAKDRKDTALTLLSLGSGLTQPSWGRVWMLKQALAGLQDSFVILPAMSPGENFLEGSDDCCRGLPCFREVLLLQSFTGYLEQFCSHSSKANVFVPGGQERDHDLDERLTHGRALAETIVKAAK
ncbi:unnamed protein product, partial [Symbiodinium sp. CCMP2456]